MPLKLAERQEVPSWLSAIIPEALPQVFPLREVLTRSLYYPSCGVDGRPVQFLGGFLHSFVYVDYGVGETGLDRVLEAFPFHGYRLSATRDLTERDLAPDGWMPRVPERFRRAVQGLDRGFVAPPFGRWLIFDRQPAFGEDHGPRRFSLVYVGGDGVATYQALYLQQQVAPLVLVIIRPGHGFGLNYTDFEDPQGFLAETALRMNRDRIPEYLVCGGAGRDYHEAFWPADYPELVEYFQFRCGNGIWRRSRSPQEPPAKTVKHP